MQAGPAESSNHLNLELCQCINQTGIPLVQLTQLILSFLCHKGNFLSVCIWKVHPIQNMRYMWVGCDTLSKASSDSCEDSACVLTEHALCVAGQLMPVITMLLLELLHSRENSTCVLYAAHVLFLGPHRELKRDHAYERHCRGWIFVHCC